MAILEKEAFMNLIRERIGDSTSDEDLKFLEDVTDTYNDLEQKSNSDNTNEWEEKYNNLDKEWREKYKARFFQTDNGNDDDDDNDSRENNDDIQIDDLFKTENE